MYGTILFTRLCDNLHHLILQLTNIMGQINSTCSSYRDAILTSKIPLLLNDHLRFVETNHITFFDKDDKHKTFDNGLNPDGIIVPIGTQFRVVESNACLNIGDSVSTDIMITVQPINLQNINTITFRKNNELIEQKPETIEKYNKPIKLLLRGCYGNNNKYSNNVSDINKAFNIEKKATILQTICIIVIIILVMFFVILGT